MYPSVYQRNYTLSATTISHCCGATMSRLIIFVVLCWLFYAAASDEALTRRRRFVVFPAGASFQVVFCFTYTNVANSYFVFGHTAALAWELPSEHLFYDQRDYIKKEEAMMTTTTSEVTTVDSNDTHDRLSYIPPSWNPVSVYKNPRYSTINTDPYDSRSHMAYHIPPQYHTIHRRTRRDLYRKLEKFLPKINLDGQECVLKAICEMSQDSGDKGTFIEEVFKAVFRAKAHEDHEDEDEFDRAASSHNCEDLYRGCKGSVKNVRLVARK